MNDSILDTIKTMLGPSADDTHFDPDIITHINSALMELNGLGVGTDGFVITDKTATWKQFESRVEKLSALKTYVYLSVKLDFDPPTTAAVLTAISEKIKKLEWKLCEAAEREEEIQNG